MKLYGDDFYSEQIEKWLKDEAEFHDITIGERLTCYGPNDDIINQKVFLKRYLKDGKFLDFGCADGLILDRFLARKKLKIDYFGIDSSSELIKEAIRKNPKRTFIVRKDSGPLPFEDGFFDFVTAVSVLHHIPNVGATLKEFTRVLKKGGYLYIKDPITDMKKMDGKRIGLSPHERGIPVSYYLDFCVQHKLKPVKIVYLGFGPLNFLEKIFTPFSLWLRNNLDFLLCNLFRFNSAYSRKSLYKKIAPTYVALVLQKM